MMVSQGIVHISMVHVCAAAIGQLAYYDLSDAPPHVPYILETLLTLLHPIASKWQALGEALSLDEDRLDEIYTNNEREEDCLREMLKYYMMNSDFQHSWEEMATVLKRINEEIIAERIQDYRINLGNMSVPSIGTVFHMLN